MNLSTPSIRILDMDTTLQLDHFVDLDFIEAQTHLLLLNYQ